ncbi:hypothetical protein [Methanobrevibacter sp.]|uniref:hypothetical protein n=1 Tax=Methanobrevibacter sp. TaxID=66852 RepID=UPI0026DF0D7E|nr:hypothetical protein [Methanobrevibacter sp.]
MSEIYKKVLLKNIAKTLESYSYKFLKTLEIEPGTINCLFKKNDDDIIIVTFSYKPTTEFQKHKNEGNYLNEGFYRKTINGKNGFYGIITESDKKWEKFTYLLNNETLMITISRLVDSSIPMTDLVKDYLNVTN